MGWEQEVIGLRDQGMTYPDIAEYIKTKYQQVLHPEMIPRPPAQPRHPGASPDGRIPLVGKPGVPVLIFHPEQRKIEGYRDLEVAVDRLRALRGVKA